MGFTVPVQDSSDYSRALKDVMSRTLPCGAHAPPAHNTSVPKMSTAVKALTPTKLKTLSDGQRGGWAGCVDSQRTTRRTTDTEK